MVEYAKVSGKTAQHWELLRGVARHDLGVLVIGGLTSDLTGEGADVVGDESVHGGRRSRRWGIPRLGHPLTDLEPVVVVTML